MVLDEVKKSQIQQEQNSSSEEDFSLDEENIDEEAEYEAWKLRELKRLKRRHME